MPDFERPNRAGVRLVAHRPRPATIRGLPNRESSAEIAAGQRPRPKTAQPLLDELNHRFQNTLAIIQAIALQSFWDASPDQRDAFQGRLHALALAHSLLGKGERDMVDVRTIVELPLALFERRSMRRFSFDGPQISLPSAESAVMTMILHVTMVLHELATNALKYGALSNDRGTVSVSWAEVDGPKNVQIRWREQGGPPVTAPKRKGFGTSLLENSFDGSVKIDYLPDGVLCIIDISTL